MTIVADWLLTKLEYKPMKYYHVAMIDKTRLLLLKNLYYYLNNNNIEFEVIRCNDYVYIDIEDKDKVDEVFNVIKSLASEEYGDNYYTLNDI